MKTKTNNNLILNALGILAVSIFSVMFVLPMHANAGFYSAGSGTSAPSNPTNPNPSYPPVTNPTPTYSNPTPVIYSISPNSANTTSNPVTVVITGANFVPGSMARWNSAERATTFINSNTLTMTLTTSDMAGVGAYSVTVLSPQPGGGMSNAALFHLNKPTTTATTTTPKKTPPAATTKSTPTKSTNTGNSLAAGALFGANGLMPTTLTQWLLLLALILLIVILARKAFAQEKPKQELHPKHA